MPKYNVEKYFDLFITNTTINNCYAFIRNTGDITINNCYGLMRNTGDVTINNCYGLMRNTGGYFIYVHCTY